MPKKKWYVVWKGVETGIYETWDDCRKQIDGVEGALYKSFDSHREACEAYQSVAWNYIGKKGTTRPVCFCNSNAVVKNSLAVDAACSGNPGKMEYRGVYTASGEEIFHVGPLEQGTNNIGEFLAIVHGLAILKKQHLDIPLYSDSVNAILWVKNKKCTTKLVPNEVNKPIFGLIERAENWLKNNTFANLILKWETKQWGEIPADFGRK
jgi:ribonuclease HI